MSNDFSLRHRLASTVLVSCLLFLSMFTTITAQDEDSLLTLRHEDWVFGATWNADETRILTWSLDATVQVWDADETSPTVGESLLSLEHGVCLNSAAWNADETRVLTCEWDGIAKVWDVDPSSPTFSEELLRLHHGIEAEEAVWNADETHILIWAVSREEKGGIVQVWDADSASPTVGEILFVLDHEDWLEGVAWNSSGTQILTRLIDGTVQIWDADSTSPTVGEVLVSLGHENRLSGATWNGDETQILTLEAFGSARVWDVKETSPTFGEVLYELPNENTEIIMIGASWNRDESRIVTWGRDLLSKDIIIRVWDVYTGPEIVKEFVLITPGIHDLEMGVIWNSAETEILTWSTDGTARVWDAESGELLRQFHHEEWVEGATWNRDESRILTWSIDGTTRIWDATVEN